MRGLSLIFAAAISCTGVSIATAADFGYAPPLYVPYGYAPAHVVPSVPCRYPDGWNAGDAAQELRGVPAGIDHRCRINRAGIVVDRDGDPTK
jgi:hypothetical protein